MADQKQGGEVVRQAGDNGIWNTEPSVVRGAVVGIVAAIGSILVIGGYVDTGEVDTVKDAAGQIVPAVFIILGIVQAVWTRFSVYSPRSAARIAVANAAKPAGAVPAMDPPP